jgi:hypothetical protein
MDKISISELRTGDILAVHNRSGFLPKGIQYFMKKWAKIRYGKKLDKYYNHTMTVVMVPQVDGVRVAHVAEAVARGYIIRELVDFHVPENIVVFKLKDQLNTTERINIYYEALRLAFGNIEYEITNFLWWIPYILSNGKVDWSPKDDKKGKKVFCFEASAMLLNAARPLFEHPDKITTVDLEFDDRFEMYGIK